MSPKPPGKPDRRDGWMPKRRDKFIKMQPDYHLIVTEGTSTEPQYFQRMKEIINLRCKGRIEVQIFGEGDNTIRLLDRACNRAQSSPNTFKHVWVVYDTDDFPADDIDNTAFRCKAISNSETVYHAIWSNQCIELWFLLHFDYFQSDIHRREYYPKLSNYLRRLSHGKYEKTRQDMFDILLPMIETAIENGKKLESVNAIKTPSKSAPGTSVHELICKLKPYFK